MWSVPLTVRALTHAGGLVALAVARPELGPLDIVGRRLSAAAIWYWSRIHDRYNGAPRVEPPHGRIEWRDW